MRWEHAAPNNRLIGGFKPDQTADNDDDSDPLQRSEPFVNQQDREKDREKDTFMWSH